MRSSWAPSALVVAAGLALQPSISLAQSNIGNAASVRNQVEGIIGGQTHTLSTGSAVHSNELIRSGEDAVANLVFIDETKLSVGPRSEVRLDKFVYDPNKKTGTVVVRATKGAYRFVTGVQDPRNYEIKTPYATLGVRGTILEVDLEGVGDAYAQAQVGDDRGPRANRTDRGCENYVKVKLVEGSFIARTISGRTVMVTEPDTVLTVCSSGSFQTTQVSESILNFSPDSAFAVVEPGIGPLALAAALGGGALAVILASERDDEPASADGSSRPPQTTPPPSNNPPPNGEPTGPILR
jgi:hypothetical protein